MATEPELLEGLAGALQGYELASGRATELAAELDNFLAELEPRAEALGLDAEPLDFLSLLEALAPERP